jgi:T-complex protein 1 subunit gamma
MHPTVVCRAYNKALTFALDILRSMASDVVDGDDKRLRTVVRSCIGTKFISRFEDQMVDLAVTAVKTVAEEVKGEGNKKIIDIKRYAKVEKIPGGELSECRVLNGVMFNKDVTHAKMSRSILNPRILLLDCPLEYKKGESNANIEIMKDSDWDDILRLEEEYIQKISLSIIKHKPDVVITEKGLSDLCQHYLVKNNITAIRRIRKTDNNRIAKVCGATICNRVEEITDGDIGTLAGKFEVRKIGDEYFTFIEECQNPKACTILLRGASKDVLNEIERNLQDAMQTARNVLTEPLLLPGGGAVEMHIAQALKEHADKVVGSEQWPFAAVGDALEVIPRTLCQNCGGDTVRVMSELRSMHSEGKNANFGIDGSTGKIVDMTKINIWEAYAVKSQTIKTAMESAIMLLRIDDICSGSKPANTAYGNALNSGQLDDM